MATCKKNIYNSFLMGLLTFEYLLLQKNSKTRLVVDQEKPVNSKAVHRNGHTVNVLATFLFLSVPEKNKTTKLICQIQLALTTLFIVAL